MFRRYGSKSNSSFFSTTSDTNQLERYFILGLYHYQHQNYIAAYNYLHLYLHDNQADFNVSQLEKVQEIMNEINQRKAKPETIQQHLSNPKNAIIEEYIPASLTQLEGNKNS